MVAKDKRPPEHSDLDVINHTPTNEQWAKPMSYSKLWKTITKGENQRLGVLLNIKIINDHKRYDIQQPKTTHEVQTLELLHTKCGGVNLADILWFQ